MNHLLKKFLFILQLIVCSCNIEDITGFVQLLYSFLLFTQVDIRNLDDQSKSVAK